MLIHSSHASRPFRSLSRFVNYDAVMHTGILHKTTAKLTMFCLTEWRPIQSSPWAVATRSTKTIAAWRPLPINPFLYSCHFAISTKQILNEFIPLCWLLRMSLSSIVTIFSTPLYSIYKPSPLSVCSYIDHRGKLLISYVVRPFLVPAAAPSFCPAVSQSSFFLFPESYMV